jgi:allantoate deiminase
MVIKQCRALARCSEEPDCTTRTFLSQPMHEVHAQLGAWMEAAGMETSIDAAGNLHGFYAAETPDAPRLYIGSHLDTVPRAGAFDGVLGVVLGVATVEALKGRRFSFAIEVIGFSDEEGVRFKEPFLGSRALVGELTNPSAEILAAIRAFGLDPARLPEAQADANALGYLEFHIEQGPVLEDLGLQVALVDSVAGQTRLHVTFRGKSNHAGTTPMHLRRDALAAAAEWVLAVEQEANRSPDLRATVGWLEVLPGAVNVIPGEARASVDARHPDDIIRCGAMESVLRAGHEIAERRGLSLSVDSRYEQASVSMDAGLTRMLERAVRASGLPAHRMASGAGHDAMIVARYMPAAMLFLRSPGGISHHPDETVLPEDVAAALRIGAAFLEELEASRA